MRTTSNGSGRNAAQAVILSLSLCVLPATAHAQKNQPGVSSEIPAGAYPGLSGTVIDQSRAILPGVTVRVRGIGAVRFDQTTRTDQSGQYFVPCLRDGLYEASFSLEGFFESSVRFQYSYPGDLHIDQMLTFSAIVAPAPLVSYLVIDKQTNQPVSGAIIETLGTDAPVETDRCGQAWDGKLGVNAITVRREGYRSSKRTIKLGAKDRVQLLFELEPIR